MDAGLKCIFAGYLKTEWSQAVALVCRTSGTIPIRPRLEHVPTTRYHLTGEIFRSDKARLAMRCGASDKSRNAVRVEQNPAFGGL